MMMMMMNGNTERQKTRNTITREGYIYTHNSETKYSGVVVKKLDTPLRPTGDCDASR
jgi:hypothetical protein